MKIKINKSLTFLLAICIVFTSVISVVPTFAASKKNVFAFCEVYKSKKAVFSIDGGNVSSELNQECNKYTNYKIVKKMYYLNGNKKVFINNKYFTAKGSSNTSGIGIYSNAFSLTSAGKKLYTLKGHSTLKLALCPDVPTNSKVTLTEKSDDFLITVKTTNKLATTPKVKLVFKMIDKSNGKAVNSFTFIEKNGNVKCSFPKHLGCFYIKKGKAVKKTYYFKVEVYGMAEIKNPSNKNKIITLLSQPKIYTTKTVSVYE